MMETISFTVLGTPAAKGRPRVGKFGVYTPKETREAERDFKVQAIKHAPKTPPDCPIAICLNIFKQKPKSKPKRVIHWTTKPDIDNFVKLALDAMNRIFWKDDAQIISINASKHYGVPARTEVVIAYLEMGEAGSSIEFLPTMDGGWIKRLKPTTENDT